jgi:hypothetical protein
LQTAIARREKVSAIDAPLVRCIKAVGVIIGTPFSRLARNLRTNVDGRDFLGQDGCETKILRGHQAFAIGDLLLQRMLGQRAVGHVNGSSICCGHG